MSCDKSSSSSTCQEITDKSPKMFKINDSVKVKKVLLHDGIIWIDGKMEKFIGKTFKIKDVLISNGLYLLENDFWYPEEALELDE
ncbi:MAG: hypothetical protein ACTSRA_00455 [Promethearchaeota archaeon]|nr:MAG: hypothetical protein [Helarchaeota virus Nidhogg Meg22_1214]